MKKKINDVCKIIAEKINSDLLNSSNYISTENMLPNFGGICSASSLPKGNVTSFIVNDILLSNIRPYFKKIWFSKFDGGCSNDVLVLRANNNIIMNKYLFYSLTNDNFINYYVASCKGTKMPRGNKDALLDWQINVPSLSEQQHIVNTIGSVDDLIEKNTLTLDLIQRLIALKYNYYEKKIKSEKSLGSLIERTGKLLKNDEWMCNDILDLSTMPSGSIYINTFSNGSNFKTNIKAINNFDIVYGSIRPYFKKAGYALDIDYIAGTVFSFNSKTKDDYLWILATIFSDKFHDFTNINSQGTKMPIINWDTFCTYTLKYDKEVISQFNQEVEPLFNIAVNKQRQSRILNKTKEILLKKYFS